MRGSRTIMLLFVLSMPSWGKAQDVHFSQLDANPLLLNPAYAGFYEGVGRVGLQYRNQWASVSQPFQTFVLTGELSLFRDRKGLGGMNVGCFLYNDKSGSLGYGTTACNVDVAYYHSLNGYDNSFLSIGAELGYGQSGFDASAAELYAVDEDFFRQQSVRYPLVGAGVAWYYQPTGLFLLKVGLSARNLNRPNVSYMGLDDVYLEPKGNVYARAEYRCWDNVAVLPVALFQHQHNNSELFYGADCKWYLDEGARRQISVSAGILMRHSDAAIINLLMEYNAFVFSFSYDANVSRLASASHTIGAFEAGLVYRIVKDNTRRKALSCPVF